MPNPTDQRTGLCALSSNYPQTHQMHSYLANSKSLQDGVTVNRRDDSVGSDYIWSLQVSLMMFSLWHLKIIANCGCSWFDFLCVLLFACFHFIVSPWIKCFFSQRVSRILKLLACQLLWISYSLQCILVIYLIVWFHSLIDYMSFSVTFGVYACISLSHLSMILRIWMFYLFQISAC